MKKILFFAIISSAIFAFSCKKDSVSFKYNSKSEVAAIANADLAAYKAGTLGDTLQKSSSGLEYIIHEQGTGAKIVNGDDVQTNYYGAFQSDGSVFDNSYDSGSPFPSTVGVTGLIAGFAEGQKLLNRGGYATLFIPSELGYGPLGSGNSIPPNAKLLYFIEVQ